MSSAALLPIFIGTYTRSTSKGIYSLALDPSTGQLSAPQLAAETKDPTYLALSPDKKTLFAVCAIPKMAVSFRVGASQGSLHALDTELPEGSGPTPCHIACDATGRALVICNYHTGVVAAAPVHSDGTTGAAQVIIHSGKGPNPKRQQTAHVHSAFITPDNKHAIVCDLGQDKIFTYRLDAASAQLAPAHPPFVAAAPGSGPRHFVFGKDGKSGYAIDEIANTVTAYAMDPWSAALTPLQTLSTVPAGVGEENTGAAIRIHPNGRFLYASNRGADNSIAIFRIDGGNGKLTPVDRVQAGGKGPRDFALSEDGRWLVCAHQDSDTIVSFSVDPNSGKLTRIPGAQAIPMPVCVLFA